MLGPLTTKDQTFLQLKKELSVLVDLEDKEDIVLFFRKWDTLDMLAYKVVLWGNFFLPKMFYMSTPPFHFDIVRYTFSNKNEYHAFPRSMGKTSLIQACIMFSVANGLDEFIAVIEKSFNEAAEVLETVKDEFRNNDMILWVYGDMVKISQRGIKDEKTKDAFGDVFINGVRLRALGFDKSCRGLKSRHTRPTKIILDDVEDDTHIANPEMRKKYLSRYLREIIPAVDPTFGKIKMFGTILHDDSLLSALIKNHKGTIQKAWDDEKVLLWPEFWTVERLEERRKDMAIEGKESAFFQEYFNEPVPEGDTIFRKEFFRYFNDFQLENEVLNAPNRKYMLVDPAISKKNRADFTAIVIVVVNQIGNIYIAEILRMKLDPYETVKAIISLYEKWVPARVGIETVSYQKSLLHILEEQKRNFPIAKSMFIQEVRADSDKERKIKSFQPYYAMGRVYHRENDPNTKLLESELLRFPGGASDDIIDALASTQQLITPIKTPVNDHYRSFLRRPLGRQVSY